MTSKGNQQRNSLDCNSSKHKIGVSDSVDQFPERGETVKAYTERVIDNGGIPDANKQSSPSMNKTKCVGDEKKSKQRSRKFQIKEKLSFNNMHGHAQSVPDGNYPAGHIGNMSSTDPSELRRNPSELKDMKCGLDCMRNGLPEENTREGVGHSDTVADRSFGASALSILKLVSGWLGEKKPLFSNLTTIIFSACDYVRIKTKQAYPIVWRCLLSIVNIMLLISVVWLDCTVRGLDSFLRMGTASFFSVIWCNIFSVIAMAGFSKFLVVMAVAALAGIFVGFTLAILVIAISATVLLWLYGSFWTTALVIFVGGLAFALKHERLALLITTLYSLYCAKTYVGWLGLFLGLNVSFISSDVLIYFLKHNFDEHGRSNIPQEEMNGTQDQPHYNGEPHTSFSETARSTDHSPGVTSTSGAETELTSEDEVVRLLNCTDHYSALGLSRYENVDVSLLKREYRKKAMLVHPDKNMGNEKAAEAFKKLQNAYEILLDTLKRKAYDDELRREDLLNYFRRFQSASQKNGRHGFFATGYAHSDADGEDSIADSRRIACKKCSNFHIWILTKKSKSQARWCQDCKDFHQARDGDGWIEQSSQPFFFGILQKVEPPSAYVCAESRIYDATEWFICQGMRCPANSHKPSFHVNTSVISKYGNTKGAGPVPRGGIPPSMEENMTEEEFFEWLQNAVQAGIFDSAGGSSSTESPSTRAANGSKSSSTSKRKKRGKKQW